MKKFPFRIRRAGKKDKSALALVYQAAYSAPPFPEKWPLAAAQKRLLELLTDPRGFGWVATVFGQPVGFCFLQTRQGFNGAYAEILETAVHPYFRGQGLERELLSGAIKFKRSRKLKTLYTLTYRGVQEKSFRQAGLARSERSLIYVIK